MSIDVKCHDARIVGCGFHFVNMRKFGEKGEGKTDPEWGLASEVVKKWFESGAGVPARLRRQAEMLVFRLRRKAGKMPAPLDHGFFFTSSLARPAMLLTMRLYALVWAFERSNLLSGER